MQLGQPLKLSKSLFMPALMSDGFSYEFEVGNLSPTVVAGQPAHITSRARLVTDLRRVSQCALQRSSQLDRSMRCMTHDKFGKSAYLSGANTILMAEPAQLIWPHDMYSTAQQLPEGGSQ